MTYLNNSNQISKHPFNQISQMSYAIESKSIPLAYSPFEHFI